MDDKSKVYKAIPIITESICGYGCGQPANFAIGKKQRPCCSERHNTCPGWKERTQKIFVARYGHSNPSNIPQFQEKRTATFVERFGATSPLKNEDIKAKQKRTNQERYGGNSPMCSNKVQAKKTATTLERYGVANVRQSKMIEDKSQATCLERYGVPFAWQAESTKEKIRKTNLERYGVDNPSKDYDIHMRGLKTRLQAKPFVLSSGKVIYLQGYEKRVLTELLRSGLNEQDFVFGKVVPAIWYVDPVTNRRHRYFPDFYVPRLNWFMEVKSLWTLFGPEKSWWPVNKAKRAAVLAAGYKFNFIIR